MKPLCRAATCLFGGLLLLSACVTAQPPAPDNSSAPLSPSQLLFFVRTSPETPIAPDDITVADAPIVVRFVFAAVIIRYNTLAPCHPKALTFFGVRETLPADICSDPDRWSLVQLYAILRAFERELPREALRYAALLRRNGLDPEDRSTDKRTAIGHGNAAGYRVAAWLAADGWNALGDLTRRDFRQAFEDYSNYRPVNSAHRIRFPLRWQPLIQNRGFGRFAAQVHVVPFLGRGRVRPLLLTPAQLRRRRAPQPYRRINWPWLGAQDARTLDALITEVFATSAGLTRRQRFLARFWENKFVSLGSFGRFYPIALYGVGASFARARWGLGEVLAQYEATLLAWKEKRRLDVLRPTSAIRQRFRGRRVRAYVGAAEGVKEIRAEDWEPLIAVQSHSEYPSASSTICSASFEHARFLTDEALRTANLSARPPLRVEIDTSISPALMETGVITVGFDSFEAAAQNCGLSRLWAGVHFRPSIPAGLQLGKGIGRLAYEHIRELANGRVPKRCVQCTVGA